MRILGMMSGTSHDGIDTAVVDFSYADGVVTGHLLHAASTPYQPALRERIVAALPPGHTSMGEVCELDTLIGRAFADRASEVAREVRFDAVGSHGQTMFHWVSGTSALGTLQLGAPAWIAEQLGVPVVADIRVRDIAAGGHGAPLASLVDAWILGGEGGVNGALNLGGISNLTVVGRQVLAFDIGPANALIDAIVTERGLHESGFDRDGAIARRGTINPRLLDLLLADPYFALPAPKSTGKEHFNADYLHRALARLSEDVRNDDLVATLTELTVRTVAEQVRAARVERLLVSGGGANNPVMMAGLRQALPGIEVQLSDDWGVPSDAKEAILVALIAWCTLHGLPGVLPGATGSRHARILGAITPGAGPLALPEPVAPPTALRMVAT